MDGDRFRGVGVALVTPFDADGRVDREAFRTHVEGQIEGGVDVLVPCGTTGESVTLDFEEQKEVVALAVEVADGRVPVLAGAGTNATADAVRLARAGRDVGADGILSVSPYYNKPTQEGLFRHYEALAGAVDVPVFVYNVPGRTSSNVAPETLLRLARIENVLGVKEASGSLPQAMTILRERPDGFLVLSGEDDLALALIAMGGDGVISVVANEVPAAFSEMIHAGLEGDLERARAIHYRLLPLMRANFVETNPIPVKTALAMMGRMEERFRLPLTPLSDAHRPALRGALEAAGALP